MNKSNRSILFVIGSMRKAGAERVISILANHYAKKGWNVSILTLLDDSCDYKLVDTINIKYVGVKGKSRRKQLLMWLGGIRKYVKDTNPEVIVSFIARINILTLISCLGLGKKVIVSERNDPYSDGRTKFIDIGTNILYRLSNKIIFQTNWAKNYFPKYIQNKGVVIPNPIIITTKATTIRKNKIVSVGRLRKQKNHSLLIEAFSELIKKYPDYELYIYGTGDLKDELLRKINDLKISDKVFLPGVINDIHEEIKDASMFVLSSNYEGLSNALLEAMSMGIPCISTNCSGINEYIENGVNGILVPINDVQCLKEKMIELIENSDLSNLLIENAIESSKKFTKEIIIDKWEKSIEG